MNLGYRWFWDWLNRDLGWNLPDFGLASILAFLIVLTVGAVHHAPSREDLNPIVVVTEKDYWQSLAGSYKRRLEKERLETLRFKRRLTRDEARIVFSHVLKEEGLDWDVEPLVEIAWRESRLYTLAQNPESSAFGVGQFLDSTWRLTGIKKTTDTIEQARAMVRYVKVRHETEDLALAYWQRNKVY